MYHGGNVMNNNEVLMLLTQDKYYNIVKEAFHSPAAQEYFKTEEIMKYLDDHKAGNADNSRKIWTVYMFLVWHKQFFEN